MASQVGEALLIMSRADGQHHILAVSWHVPPGAGGSPVIMANLAKQFSRDTMTLVGAWPWGVPSVPWNATWPRRVLAGIEWPDRWLGARWWRRSQLPSLTVRALWEAHRVRADVILAVYPSSTSLLAGALVAKLAGLRLMPYYHNFYTPNRRGWRRQVARLVEGVALQRAEHVFVMSEGMAEAFRRQHPRVPCTALVHSFAGPTPDVASPPDVHQPLRLAFSGNVNASCRDALERWVRAIAPLPDIHMTWLSPTSPGELRRMGLLRAGDDHHTVGADRLVAALQRADIVLLPHGFYGSLPQLEYDTIFPTKTIEYLLCGRPILAHSPATCFITRFLRDHDCAYLVTEPNTAALQTALARLRTDTALRQRLVRNALAAARIFQGATVASVLWQQVTRQGPRAAPLNLQSTTVA